LDSPDSDIVRKVLQKLVDFVDASAENVDTFLNIQDGIVEKIYKLSLRTSNEHDLSVRKLSTQLLSSVSTSGMSICDPNTYFAVHLVAFLQSSKYYWLLDKFPFPIPELILGTISLTLSQSESSVEVIDELLGLINNAFDAASASTGQEYVRTVLLKHISLDLLVEQLKLKDPDVRKQSTSILRKLSLKSTYIF
jgi:hypothetical protein